MSTGQPPEAAVGSGPPAHVLAVECQDGDGNSVACPWEGGIEPHLVVQVDLGLQGTGISAVVHTEDGRRYVLPE